MSTSSESPARLAPHVVVSARTASGEPLDLKVADGLLEVHGWPGYGGDQNYIELTLAPETGYYLKSVQIFWRMSSSRNNGPQEGRTLTDVWAFVGYGGEPIAKFGRFRPPLDKFATLNWAPELNAGPGEPVVFRFFGWNPASPAGRKCFVLEDVRLSGEALRQGTDSTAGRFWIPGKMLGLCFLGGMLCPWLFGIMRRSALYIAAVIAARFRRA